MDMYQTLYSLATDIGFTCIAPLDTGKLEFLPEVLEMCKSNRCNHYAGSWSCPPGCDSLEMIAEKVKAYSQGILVQTTVQLEDSFDYESMMDGYHTHQEKFLEFYEKAKEIYAEVLPMGAGPCKLCEQCTYPDQPCRFPGRMISAMEAYGLVVSTVCEACRVKYNYGPDTVTYVSCILYINKAIFPEALLQRQNTLRQ